MKTSELVCVSACRTLMVRFGSILNAFTMHQSVVLAVSEALKVRD